MTVDLEGRVCIPSKVFVESDEFRRMLESAKASRRFSDLSAMIVDATETSRWDVFRFLQREVLHLGAVSVATLLDEAGFGNVKAVYEVLTPDYDYTKENPDLIGVSAIVTNVPYANRKIEYFRRTKPDALIVAGGAGYAYCPEIPIRHGADFVVKGKAEHALLALLNKIVSNREDGRSLRAAFLGLNNVNVQGVYDSTSSSVDYASMVKDLDAVPAINYNLIQGKQSKNMRSIRDSEGCTNRCDFCSSVLLHRNKYRTVSVEKIVEEMRKAKQEGIGQVFFVGDHAFGRKYEEIEALTYAIEAANLDMSWVAQATVSSIYNNLDKGIIERLEKSRCSVLCLGVESIYDDDLAEMNADRKSSHEQLKRVLGVLRASPIEVHAMLVLKPIVDKDKRGILPFSAENTDEGIAKYRQEIDETVDFLKHYNVRSAQFHSAIPLPGTKSTQDFLDAGIVLKKVGGKLVSRAKYTGQYVVASANPLESHEIMRRAYEGFYSAGYILSPLVKLFIPSPKNCLSQIFFRTLGRGTVYAHLHSKECKEYVRALEKRDFEFYKPGERIAC